MLVMIESPYSGDIEKNTSYARLAVKDSIVRGETPFASHLFYPQPTILNEEDPEQRYLGIRLGYNWGEKAEAIIFYVDYGMSVGMHQALIHYKDLGKTIYYRTIFDDVFARLTRGAW